MDSQNIVVTGAGAGIGRALCLGFAQNGATVWIADKDFMLATETAELVRAAGGHAHAFHVDVGDERSVQASFASALGSVDKLHVLVNNAGIAYGDIYQITTIPTDRLTEVFRVNVFGMLYCARSCRQLLRKATGCIINISSMAAYMANGAYSVSKAAVNNLTLTLADEFANDGIRVNGIAPGLVNSPTALQSVGAQFRDRIQAAQLVKRGGRMEDVVAMAIFLTSEGASFISGQTLLVDGGFLRHSALAMPVPITGLPSDVI